MDFFLNFIRKVKRQRKTCARPGLRGSPSEQAGRPPAGGQPVRAARCGLGRPVRAGAGSSGTGRGSETPKEKLPGRLMRDAWKAGVPSRRCEVCGGSDPAPVREQFLYLRVSPKASGTAMANAGC